MILLSRLLMLVLVVIALIFCMSNLEPVTVKLLAWTSPQMPLFLVLLFVFFFGFFLALFWQAVRNLSVRRPEPVQKPVAPAPVVDKKKPREKRGWRRKKEKEQSNEKPSAVKGETGDEPAGKEVAPGEADPVVVAADDQEKSG